MPQDFAPPGGGSRALRLKEGDPDPVYGTIVNTLIIERDDPPAFAVWLVRRKETGLLEVWWTTQRTKDTMPKNFGGFSTEFARLEGVNISELDTKLQNDFVYALGFAMGRALEDDVESGVKMLESAAVFIRARLEEQTRKWYLAVASFGVAFSTVSQVAVFVLVYSGLFAMVKLLALATYCIGMGMIGAGTSIIARASRLEGDPASGRGLHLWEAVARVVVGGVAGFAAFLLVRAGLVGASLLPAAAAGPMLIAFLAGYTERFIGSLGESLGRFGLPNPAPDDARRKLPPRPGPEGPAGGGPQAAA